MLLLHFLPLTVRLCPSRRKKVAVGNLGRFIVLTLFNQPNNLQGLILTRGRPPSVNQAAFP